ncbi:CRISPR-associated endonuclease Cas4g/Cas1g [Desulfosoma caldarium]|uniref:CRISPR-associated endonuclease Cas1 n=1 Tax=Desulfosoma caldarium TaxID=610254 RepID=A0A3N1UIF9_9BACT|nr:CRISPR-associated endonuclease Cas1 [Desulfosoma caldarium]ROQ89903.1 CRISPR-associated Cas1 family protein /CRISPR-associated Cas4 family exonuclease [Desulfosoma caldarium]
MPEPKPADHPRPLFERSGGAPLVPARMVNEYVYCPRLAYLEWVQGEFAHNEYTVDGQMKHRNVDQKKGRLPEPEEQPEHIHARSVDLASAQLGVIARIDLVEGAEDHVHPVDYKRGKRPHVAQGAYLPERVQLCVQGLLLREHGYRCDSGVLYFMASRERVRVPFDQDLVETTLQAIQGLRETAESGKIPPPLESSPKCTKCSLVGICLPDELRFLRGNQPDFEPRPIYPAMDSALPLYVQSQASYIRKKGERLVVQENNETVAEVRLGDISQVVLYGAVGISTPALHECFRREIPVTYLSYGGWFLGHSVGTGHRNVETRTYQYRTSFDPAKCLQLARGWVAAKIANCRTLLRRNWRGDQNDDKSLKRLMALMKADIRAAARATSLDSLLGVEGAAANRYFQHFARMLRTDEDGCMAFDFEKRNRRPPRDPVNAMLSFAYAMLVREWHVVLSAVGLDPYRGFYHQPRYGRPALALDMMEPFRPLLADSAVITAINNGELHSKDFVYAAGSCALAPAGRKKFIAAFERRLGQEITHPIFKYKVNYRRILEVQARLLVRYLAGEISHYPNFITR